MMQRAHSLAGAFDGESVQPFALVWSKSAAIAAQPRALPQ